MNRDLVLARSILAYVERYGVYDGELPRFPDFEPYSREKVLYHIAMLQQAGFIDGIEPFQGARLGRAVERASDLVFRNLTWAGHNVLSQLRDT